MNVSVSEYSRILGVHPQTLRRWEREHRAGLIAPTRTPGNHRRYALAPTCDITVGYARVSSHDQKADLPCQVERLNAHAAAHGHCATVVTDIGSGLNCNKPGLRSLLRLLLSGRVRELLLTYKDRLPADFGPASPYSITQPIGERWLAARRSAILRVPSAVVAGEFNFVLNPAHPLFASALTWDAGKPVNLDPRLWM